MDLQKMFDTISNVNRSIRSNYHVTLGDLIEQLGKKDPSIPVVFDDGSSPAELGSYRGYYDDLAICTDSSSDMTVGGLLRLCRDAVGRTFTGYKGGEYMMEIDTPLWRAEYGCTGPAIVDAALVDGKFVLKCKEID